MLFSITDEEASTKDSKLYKGYEDDEDEGEEIIKSINSLLNKGKSFCVPFLRLFSKLIFRRIK